MTPKEALWDYWVEIAKGLSENLEDARNLNYCLERIGSNYRLCEGKKETHKDGSEITTWYNAP